MDGIKIEAYLDNHKINIINNGLRLYVQKPIPLTQYLSTSYMYERLRAVYDYVEIRIDQINCKQCGETGGLYLIVYGAAIVGDYLNATERLETYYELGELNFKNIRLCNTR